MKLYAISGLGADKRVYNQLTLDYDLIPIDWLKPNKRESVEDYAGRLSVLIETNEAFGIIGVSFGGLIAVELSKILNPDITILISSIETKSELPILYRMLGKLNILKIVPPFLYNPPKMLAHWLFGVQNKQLLNNILNDTDLSFAKWALNAMFKWKNTERIKNKKLIITGSRDKLLPPAKSKDQIMIDNGQHFMIVDRAKEISQIINEGIKSI